MNRTRVQFGFAFLSVTWVAALGYGQVPQVIQLPTYTFFSVNTTVSVPDRGGMFLGGVQSAYSGSSTQGVPGLSHLPGANRLFKNRAIGHEAAASGAWVTAQIHDLRAMDEAILAQAAALDGKPDAAQTVVDSRAAQIRANLAQHSRPTSRPTEPASNAAPRSVAEIRQQLANEQAQLDAEARELLAEARAAEAAGKTGAARVLYQMAARRSRLVTAGK